MSRRALSTVAGFFTVLLCSLLLLGAPVGQDAVCPVEVYLPAEVGHQEKVDSTKLYRRLGKQLSALPRDSGRRRGVRHW